MSTVYHLSRGLIFRQAKAIPSLLYPRRHTSTTMNEGTNGLLKTGTEQLIKSFREDLRKVSSDATLALELNHRTNAEMHSYIKHMSAEMHSSMKHMVSLVVGVVVLGFAGGGYTLILHDFWRDQQLDALDQKFDARLNALDQKFDARFNALNADISAVRADISEVKGTMNTILGLMGQR